MKQLFTTALLLAILAIAVSCTKGTETTDGNVIAPDTASCWACKTILTQASATSYMNDTVCGYNTAAIRAYETRMEIKKGGVTQKTECVFSSKKGGT